MRLKTSTPGECRKSLSRLVNLCADGKIDCKRANTAIFGINSILSALRLDETEKRLQELEELLEEYEGKS